MKSYNARIEVRVTLKLDDSSGATDCRLQRSREVNFHFASAPPRKSYWLTNCASAELHPVFGLVGY